ncbi:MAG: 4-(cytidine 5'-diphospho)-2-C-methyl-D-erythritol kinase [Magnetococcales bacterium]|nr:4-(cytidine 5'-diphospho)-2-C-methyl-D-erythritol kinase [Magnetococcales bacterium]
MTIRRFSAPAKLNLALRVVGKRGDGYHLLQSVMVFFPLYDQLEITLTPRGLELTCVPEVTVSPEENLVFRAAAALREACGVTGGASMRLRKGIPDGAGLGGGSSDAALTLLALDRMWGLGLGPERLLSLGESLGADVPFFLGGRSAWVAGVGERLTPLTQCPVAEMVLVFPGVSLATGRVFQALSGSFSRQRPPLVLPMETGALARFFENDLEAPARGLAPVIGEVSLALRRVGALGSVMSGSGSSVFGLFADAVAARDACARLRAGHGEWRVFSGGIFHLHPFAKEWDAGGESG